MRVLVTGGAGFIGTHIVQKLLNEGLQVVIIDNFSTGSRDNIPSTVKIIEADITDHKLSEKVKGEKFDALIHLAAQASVSFSVAEPLLDMKANIEGTLNMLALAKNSGCKKFIFSSTAAVYGDTNNLPIQEDEILDPLTPYGISKMTAEHYIKTLCPSYGIDYVIVRYANVYGPKQTSSGEGGVIKIFCDQLLKGKSATIFGDGEQTRDFIYVEDVATATVKALSCENKILNVSTKSETTVNEIYDMIAREMNIDKEANYASIRDGDIVKSCLDNEVMVHSLKWKPQYTLQAGIKKTINNLN